MILSKHTFNVEKHTFKERKYIVKVRKYIAKVQKYTFKVQDYTFEVQSNCRKPWPGTFLIITSGSWNPVPRNGSVKTSGTEPNPSEPIKHRNLRNLLNRNLGTAKPVETRILPGTAPARPEHTEIYNVQRPHSILLLGKNIPM